MFFYLSSTVGGHAFSKIISRKLSNVSFANCGVLASFCRALECLPTSYANLEVDLHNISILIPLLELSSPRPGFFCLVDARLWTPGGQGASFLLKYFSGGVGMIGGGGEAMEDRRKGLCVLVSYPTVGFPSSHNSPGECRFRKSKNNPGNI